MKPGAIDVITAVERHFRDTVQAFIAPDTPVAYILHLAISSESSDYYL